MVSALLYLLAAPALLANAARTIKIVNNCPTAIKVFVNGNSQGSLNAKGGSSSTSVPNNFSGYIYTSANGGAQSAAGSTRAGFFGSDAYYYVVVDSRGFNTGVSISPNRAPVGNFCNPVTCNSATCSGAFSSNPANFPSPPSKGVTPPLFSCPGNPNNIGFTVTFCPSGTFPAINPPPANPGKAIHPNGNQNKCLDVRGAIYANGTPVQIYDCNGTGAQKWIVNSANTKVQVSGTNFCLDAGTNPSSGTGMKIWTCYAGLAAQAWYYTDDNRIAVTGSGQCLDLTGGVLTNGNQVQTWQCTNNNNNQVWTV